MKKVMLIFGTRPEAIKMCPLVKEFQKDTINFKTVVCVTASIGKCWIKFYMFLMSNLSMT